MSLLAPCQSLTKAASRTIVRGRLAPILGVGVLVALAFLSTWLRVPKIEPAEEFRWLKVGGQVPRFRGVSMAGRELGTGQPAGEFHVYVIDERLPPICLDWECGEQAEAVVQRGGHLIGGSDHKFAKVFGVKVVKTNALTRRLAYRLSPEIVRWARHLGLKVRRDFWRLEAPLTVVADCDGRIVGIFKNASIKHVPRILRRLQDADLRHR